MLEADEHLVEQSLADESKTYEVITEFPEDEPTIKVIFNGLMCFCFDGKDGCEVGIHNTTRGLGRNHMHPHELSVNVWVKGETCPSQPLVALPSAVLESVDNIDIAVLSSRRFDGVFVYQKDRERFDRTNSADEYRRDWRWVLDFEGPDLYGNPSKKLSKHTKTLTPRVRINNGLFYTLRRTDATFVRCSGHEGSDHSADRQLGHVAEFVAANIYLEAGGIAALSIGEFTFPIASLGANGPKYQIDITNNCRHGNNRCKFDPDARDKKERNDFYLYYDTFEIPANEPEHMLIYTGKGKMVKNLSGELDICVDKRRGKGMFSDDKAPCGAMGFGSSRGID